MTEKKVLCKRATTTFAVLLFGLTALVMGPAQAAPIHTNYTQINFSGEITSYFRGGELFPGNQDPQAGEPVSGQLSVESSAIGSDGTFAYDGVEGGSFGGPDFIKDFRIQFDQHFAFFDGAIAGVNSFDGTISDDGRSLQSLDIDTISINDFLNEDFGFTLEGDDNLFGLTYVFPSRNSGTPSVLEARLTSSIAAPESDVPEPNMLWLFGLLALSGAIFSSRRTRRVTAAEPTLN